MLRPADIVDLGERLRVLEWTVSAQQLNAAMRLVAGARSPANRAELTPWLAPIFCTDETQQREFAGHYRRWLHDRWPEHRETAPPVDTDRRDDAEPDRAPDLKEAVVPEHEPAGAWRDFVSRLHHDRLARLWALGGALALLLAVFSGMVAWHWLQPREMRIHVKGPEGSLADARVAIDQGSTVLQTDKEGLARHTYRRLHLPLTLSATHVIQHEGQQLLPTTRKVEQVPEGMVELQLQRRSEQPPPPEQPVRASARWLGALAAPDLLPGPDVKGSEPRVDWVLVFALFGLALLPVLWWLWSRRLRQAFLERLPADANADEQWLRSLGQQPLAGLLADLRSLGRDLRRRVRVPSRELDVKATLRATVRRAGMMQMVHGTLAEPEHLVLIDRGSRRDHLARLARDILADLHAQGVLLDSFVFDGNPERCHHAPVGDAPALPGAYTLANLHGRYPNARLLVFSDGQRLIHPITGEPQETVTQLCAWEQAVLITPQSRAQWSAREWLLDRAGLSVLPLEALSLKLLGDLLMSGREAPRSPPEAAERGRALHLRNTYALLDRTRPEPEFIERLMRSLRGDLGEDGFSWLCGCAVYPDIHWGVTLEVGRAVALAAPGRPVPRLADLARLPWMRHGFMPDWLREALLQRFPANTERTVRAALAQFLKTLAKAERPDAPDTFVVAKPPPLSARLLAPWQAFKNWFHPEPAPGESAGAEDLVFLRFMSGPQRLLAMPVVRHLLKLLFPHGIPLLGLRAWLPLLGLAAALGTLAWRPPMLEGVRSAPGLAILPNVRALAIDSDGLVITVADEFGDVRRFDAASQRLLGTQAPVQPRRSMDTAGLQAMAWSFLDGRSFYAAANQSLSPDTVCAFLRVKASAFLDRAELKAVLGPDVEPTACVLSVGLQSLVVLDSEGNLHLISQRIATGRSLGPDSIVASKLAPFVSPTAGWRIQRIGKAPVNASALAVSDDGRTVAVLQADGNLLLLRGIDHKAELLEDARALSPIALSGDGRLLAATRSGGDVDLWQLDPGRGRDVAWIISSPAAEKSEREAFQGMENIQRLTRFVDLTGLHIVLSKRYGFQTFAFSPSRTMLVATLDDIARQASAQDRLIIVYDGPSSSGSWSLPDDANNMERTTFSNAELADWLGRLPTRQVLVINSTSDAAALASAAGLSSQGASANATRVVLASTADRGSRINSKYLQALYSVLATQTTQLSAQALNSQVSAELRSIDSAAQVPPWYGPWPGAGHVNGDFTLRPIGPPMKQFMDRTAGNTRYVGQFLRQNDGTVTGTGRVEWTNGDVYEGPLVHSRRQGVGEIRWATGQRYKGEWKDDRATGRGLMVFANGNQFDGTLVDGQPEGEGKLTYKSGDVYTGQIRNGVPHGKGIYVWLSGQRYEGDWIDDRPQGQGKMRFANGNQYDGQIASGLPQGEGRMTFPSGDVYEGEFDAGKASGQGVYQWKTGERYEGAWTRGLKNGKGIFYWPTGDRWEGQFKDDERTEDGQVFRKGS